MDSRTLREGTISPVLARLATASAPDRSELPGQVERSAGGRAVASRSETRARAESSDVARTVFESSSKGPGWSLTGEYVRWHVVRVRRLSGGSRSVRAPSRWCRRARRAAGLRRAGPPHPPPRPRGDEDGAAGHGLGRPVRERVRPGESLEVGAPRRRRRRLGPAHHPHRLRARLPVRRAGRRAPARRSRRRPRRRRRRRRGAAPWPSGRRCTSRSGSAPRPTAPASPTPRWATARCWSRRPTG